MKLIQITKDRQQIVSECDQLVVLDEMERPVVVLLTIAPGTILYSHCGEPSFIEYLKKTGLNLKSPQVIVRDITQLLPRNS